MGYIWLRIRIVFSFEGRRRVFGSRNILGFSSMIIVCFFNIVIV